MSSKLIPIFAGQPVMLHKNLPKNNRIAKHKTVKSPDKGDNSAIYNSKTPSYFSSVLAMQD